MSPFSALFGKSDNYLSEYKRFKKAIQKNPMDQGLKAQFIKFCLLNRFTKHEAVEDHVAEALKMFEGIENSDNFDLQSQYLVGKYYQEERDVRRAYRVYLNAIKRFNQKVGANPELKGDNVELAYSISLNLMTLQLNPVDPELERCFKIIRKSYPLHLKRIELENEMSKPAPDKERLKALSAEVRRLKEEEDKSTAEPAAKSAPGETKVLPVISSSVATPVATVVETPKAVTPVASTETSKTVTPAAELKTAPVESKAASVEPKSVATPAATHAADNRPREAKGFFSKLFQEMAPSSMGLSGLAPSNVASKPFGSGDKGSSSDGFTMHSQFEAGDRAFMIFHNNQWEGPFTPSQLKAKNILLPGTWVCRVGSQQVIQAYETPDLNGLFEQKVP